MILIAGKECWNARGVALLIGLGRNTLLRALRNKNILTKNNTVKDAKYKQYIITRITNKNGFMVNVPFFTKEGLDFLKDFLSDVPRKVEPPFKEKYDNALADTLDSL